MGVKVPRKQIAEAQQALLRSLTKVPPEVADKVCWACGCDEQALDRAHLVARAHGGTDEPDNLILLCRLCHAEHPDGQPVETQLLWLNLHETWLDRKEREFSRVMAALESIGRPDELQDYFTSRTASAEPRTAATGAHTVLANAAWGMVSEFLTWKAQRVT